MEDANKTLLPYICEYLCQVPAMSATYDEIKKEVKKALGLQNWARVDNALERSLFMGENLGVLTLSQDGLEIPLKPKSPGSAPAPEPVSTSSDIVKGPAKPVRKKQAKKKSSQEMFDDFIESLPSQEDVAHHKSYKKKKREKSKRSRSRSEKRR